jgi:hypothetical protein
VNHDPKASGHEAHGQFAIAINGDSLVEERLGPLPEVHPGRPLIRHEQVEGHDDRPFGRRRGER